MQEAFSFKPCLKHCKGINKQVKMEFLGSLSPWIDRNLFSFWWWWYLIFMLVTNVFLYQCAFGSSGTSMLSHTPPGSPFTSRKEREKERHFFMLWLTSFVSLLLAIVVYCKLHYGVDVKYQLNFVPFVFTQIKGYSWK